MLHGMHLSAAGALVEDARQAVIANNIANSQTAGYKAETVSFRRRLTEARDGAGAAARPDPVLDGLSGGVFVDQISFSRRPGPLFATGKPLDLGLRGDGFFAVSDGQRTLYTRSGSFGLNAAGEIVTADGRFRLLGTNGRPIRVGAGQVEVGPRGDVTVDGRPGGKVLVAGKLDPSQFEKVGGGYFRFLGPGSPPASSADVAQGYLEASDVNEVGEMVKLIESHRAYEANLQMVRLQDSTLGRAANELGRITA